MCSFLADVRLARSLQEGAAAAVGVTHQGYPNQETESAGPQEAGHRAAAGLRPGAACQNQGEIVGTSSLLFVRLCVTVLHKTEVTAASAPCAFLMCRSPPTRGWRFE